MLFRSSGMAGLAKAGRGDVASGRDGEKAVDNTSSPAAATEERRLDREALNKIREQVYGIF